MEPRHRSTALLALTMAILLAQTALAGLEVCLSVHGFWRARTALRPCAAKLEDRGYDLIDVVALPTMLFQPVFLTKIIMMNIYFLTFVEVLKVWAGARWVDGLGSASVASISSSRSSSSSSRDGSDKHTLGARVKGVQTARARREASEAAAKAAKEARADSCRQTSSCPRPPLRWGVRWCGCLTWCCECGHSGFESNGSECNGSERNGSERNGSGLHLAAAALRRLSGPYVREKCLFWGRPLSANRPTHLDTTLRMGFWLRFLLPFAGSCMLVQLLSLSWVFGLIAFLGIAVRETDGLGTAAILARPESSLLFCRVAVSLPPSCSASNNLHIYLFFFVSGLPHFNASHTPSRCRPCRFFATLLSLPCSLPSVHASRSLPTVA